MRMRLGLFFFCGWCMGGCFGNSNIEKKSDEVKPTAPFVEAYLEYLGPSEKWAGPASFVIHLDARGNEGAKISLVNSKFAEEGLSAGRAPAGVEAKKNLSAEAFREELKNFSQELDKNPNNEMGLSCLYPIVARLIRSDGAVTLHQGCRGQMGFSSLTSQFANRLLQNL